MTKSLASLWEHNPRPPAGVQGGSREGTALVKAPRRGKLGKDFMQAFLGRTVFLLLLACKLEQPGVDEKTQGRPAFTHFNDFTKSCDECHEPDRKPPVAGVAHGLGRNCVGCHSPKDDRTGWLPLTLFTHEPPPKTCYPCHQKERPPPNHPPDGDCALCHRYKNASGVAVWEPFF